MQNPKKTCDDLVVFILSHGNPNEVLTVRSLNRHGYTGAWYIVLDDTDPTISEYQKVFGADRILLFEKRAVAQTFDEFGKSLGERNTVVYARNACFELAKQLGYTYFMEFDDDYYEFDLRYEDNGHLRNASPNDLDSVFNAFLEWYKGCPQITSLCMAQGGDFLGGVGGKGSQFHKKFLRKAMNTFLCSTERPFTFVGRLNEDTNTYCLLGSQGKLFCTVIDASIGQTDTQQKDNLGGMTGAYVGMGTYCKSFYSVICCPSFVKIGIVGNNHARIHHNVDWKHAVPKIISSRYKQGYDNH